MQGRRRDCGLGGDLAKAVALAVEQPRIHDLVSRVGDGPANARPAASTTTRACAARSAVEGRSISADRANEGEAPHCLLGGVDRQRVYQ